MSGIDLTFETDEDGFELNPFRTRESDEAREREPLDD